MFLDGCRSTCTVVFLRGISGGIKKCHMQTYLCVMVINKKRQGHLFQNMKVSLCRSDSNVLIDLRSRIS